ncbi:MAG: EutN/CcmL family microcompartment protein [bacterium]
MELARVEGTVVATAKTDRLQGFKLLLVNLIAPDLKPSNNYLVAVDSVGAGEGEIVIVVRGSSARQADQLTNVPTDSSIIAIVDAVEQGGKLVYKKNSSTK